MTTGRNDPCPCGSGKKYKHCCQSRDVDAGRADLRNAVREAAHASSEWAVDAIPLLARFEDGRSPRPVLMLVVAGGSIIYHDMRGRLRGEIADVAAALEAAVVAAARDVGVFPEHVRVRHDETASALAPLLAARDVDVSGGGAPSLEEAARPLVEALSGSAMWPPMCRPDSWSAWGLPNNLVRDLFSAAARFHRMEPWLVMSNLQAPRAVLPSGREWTCCALGNAGMELGLVLYSVASDLFEVTQDADSNQPFLGLQGRVISLSFDKSIHAGDIQREARLNRWDVSAPAAIPVLTTINTPGGGVSQDDIRDMIRILDALPAFAAKNGRALMREEQTGTPVKQINWKDADSGVSFRYEGEAAHYVAEGRDNDVAFDSPLGDLSVMRAEFDAIVQRTIEELGPNVGKDEMLAALNRSLHEATTARNNAPQADMGGLSPSQVGLLIRSDWVSPSSAIHVRHDLTPEQVAPSTILSNARALLSFMVENGPLGATSAGNLKLDVVAALAERIILPDRYLEQHRKYSKRTTEHDVWPLHTLRIVCELAGLIKKKSTRFSLTRKGTSLADPARAGKLYAHLFHTWFRTFSIDYGGRWEWPELQHQIAYTLYRLRTEAREWSRAEELVDRVVVPFALVHAPVLDLSPPSLASTILQHSVLDALEGFAFLERAEAARSSFGYVIWQYRVTSLAAEVFTFDL